MSTLKYKARDRYPRVFMEKKVIRFGDYALITFGESEVVFDISFTPVEGDPHYARLKQVEFVSYIEAFLQEKKDGESNTVQRGDHVGLDTRHSAGESEGQV